MIRRILTAAIAAIVLQGQAPTIPPYEYHWVIQPPAAGKGYFGAWETNGPNNQSASTSLTNDLQSVGGTGSITLAYELLYNGIFGCTPASPCDGTLATINTGSQLTNVKAIYASGEIPMTTIGCNGGTPPSNYSLEQESSGTYDQYIIDAANAVKSLTSASIDPAGHGYIIIRPFWEWPLNVEDAPTFPQVGNNPNGNNCFIAGESYAQQAADYITWYQHIHDIFQQHGVKNVTWAFCPTVGPADSSQKVTQTILDMFWPGDLYADMICIDAYPKGGLNWVHTNGSSNANINVKAWLQEHETNGRWGMVGETADCAQPINGTDIYGVTIYCSGGVGNTQCQYFNQIETQSFTSGGDTYGLIDAVTYFDHNAVAAPGGWDWNFDSLASIACFQTMTTNYGVQIGNNVAWGI